MNPIKASLRYPAITLTLTLGLLLAGTQAILHMPRMEDPSVTIRTGIVAIVYPGATSDHVRPRLRLGRYVDQPDFSGKAHAGASGCGHDRLLAPVDQTNIGF